ncbi:MAG: phenylalanine--tRNA ligase subunit beta [Gemmataceae bacterium]|nr:phenylalanine--tRNA ligase subunit beta [Gemmataceae bacterium]MDW8266040.1 phenylalanine--tRNA ligase subunit beta [Gemmataceae bacterium]
MKVPLSWLREYVDLSVPLPELVERLTLAGLEVSGVRVYGLPLPEGLHVKPEDVGPVWDRDKVLLARVLSTEKHPNADKLKLVTVDYGAGEPKVVVTGAPNIRVGDAGQRVVIGLSGTTYWDGHVTPKQLSVLKPTKIRGVPSDAMVMSEFELGISDDHEGVIILQDDVPPPGTPLADFLGDIVLEIDVLPNMARCLSMIGMAREVAALTGQTLRLPPPAMQAGGPASADWVEVAIEDPKLSARYAAAVVRGVRVGPAPEWMRWRLTYAGMRPINNIVDITNYVMLEWGQPLHAFDYDRLRERAGGQRPRIMVRSARAGEVLTTLDQVKRPLTPDNLVIADGVGPVALAGVMGGADTEVSDQTTNVLLESANFDFVSIRRTMQAFNLPSEASQRFSRGLHPATVGPAAERAAELMRLHAGGTICQGLVDCYPAPPEPQVVSLPLREVRRQLGIELPVGEVRRILEALEFRVEATGPETLRVTVPPHRCDIQVGAADLIEELVRVHGYDRLPATLLADQLPEQHTNRSLVLEERVRDILVHAGLQEVITYALTRPEAEAPLGPPVTDYLRLKNPISSERVVMRQRVLAGVLEVVVANLRHTEDVRLFEIGWVYLLRPGQRLPDEPRRLAVVLTGYRSDEFWGEPAGAGRARLDFFDLKGIVESLVEGLHLSEVGYRPTTVGFLHPGQAAEVVVQGRGVGVFGRLHPKVVEAYGGGSRAMLVAEFDLEALLAAVPERHCYTPVPRFPAALRDVAVIVPESMPAERVAAEIRAAGGDLLRQLRLFDVYRGDSIPAGTKSLAYALTYQADDRTLTDKEVDRAHKKIEDRLKHVLKALIRGKDFTG